MDECFFFRSSSSDAGSHAHSEGDSGSGDVDEDSGALPKFDFSSIVLAAERERQQEREGSAVKKRKWGKAEKEHGSTEEDTAKYTPAERDTIHSNTKALLGRELHLIVNGYLVGKVTTATAIPPVGQRFLPSYTEVEGVTHKNKEPHLLDGVVPIISFTPVIFESHPWFVHPTTGATKKNDCLSAKGDCYKSISEVLSANADNKMTDEYPVIFWIDHMYLHDLDHVGGTDSSATESCHQAGLYHAGCFGCEKAVRLHANMKKIRTKPLKKQKATYSSSRSN